MMQIKVHAVTILGLSLLAAPLLLAYEQLPAHYCVNFIAAIQSAGSAGQSSQVELPPGQPGERLRVLAGRSLVIRSPEPLKRVSVTNEQVAYAIIVSPNQVVIHGIKPGIVTLVLWDEKEDMRPFDLEVQLDLRSPAEVLRRLFPSENIEVSQSGSGLVLRGTVSTQEVADRVLNVAKAETANVVSLLNVTPPPPSKVVSLQVRFAEVDRNAVQELGLNIISTGALNTPGAITTGQFRAPAASGLTGVIGAPVTGTTSDFTLSDILNIFVFRPDLNLGLTIKALEQRNLLQILAEPNLLALGGKEASFLAGGEFPVPIVQGGTGIQTVTVQYKEFGVRLKFVADPQPDGLIHLKVTPEVSTLDYSNAVTLSGFLIPALTTRRTETEVELQEGQSFAIAGLIDKRLTEVFSKIPWLGDIPLLGRLFQSRSFRQNNTELLVMVTPQIVKPLEPGQLPPGPAFPGPFLDDRKFDGKKGEAPISETPKPWSSDK